MTGKQRAALAVEAMKETYPEATLTLEYTQPHELLFATRLAAQCTDIRVNKVTKVLFPTYPTIKDFATADVKDVEKIVRPCGLGPTKARDLVGAAQMILEDFDGEVPSAMEDLLKLPGIGRKTANVMRGDYFGLPAIVTDTHCIRLTNFLGLTTSKNPEVVEKQLAKILDPKESNDFCHRLVLHGRAVCVARRPQCPECNMWSFCKNAPQKYIPPETQS